MLNSFLLLLQLPHLAGALETALRLIHTVIFVCDTVEVYSQALTAEPLLEALIGERGRVRAGGKHLRCLLVSLVCYVTLLDEPKIAWRALEVMRLICEVCTQFTFALRVQKYKY
jgi:hypothetical protein